MLVLSGIRCSGGFSGFNGVYNFIINYNITLQYTPVVIFTCRLSDEETSFRRVTRLAELILPGKESNCASISVPTRVNHLQSGHLSLTLANWRLHVIFPAVHDPDAT